MTTSTGTRSTTSSPSVRSTETPSTTSRNPASTNATSASMRRTCRMAEIEFLLPTVQYGNVKVRATPEELGIDSVQDAGALGVAAAVYLNLFTQGFKVGTQIDVDYEATHAPESASEEAPPGDPQGA